MRTQSTSKEKQIISFIIYNIKNLTMDRTGAKTYLDNFDNIIDDIFGVKHFARNLSTCRYNDDFLRQVERLGIKTCVDMLDNPNLYELIKELTQIDYAIDEIKKMHKRKSKRGKKVPKDSIKELKFYMKIYKKAIKEIKSQLGIKDTPSSYKKRYAAVLNLIDSDAYYDSSIFDTDDFDDFADFDDIEDDYRSYRVTGHRSLDDFASNRSSKRQSIKHSSFNIDEEDKEFSSEFDPEDDDNFDDDDDEYYDELSGKLEQLSDVVLQMTDTIQTLANTATQPSPANNDVTDAIAYLAKTMERLAMSQESNAKRMDDLIDALTEDVDDEIGEDVPNSPVVMSSHVSVPEQFEDEHEVTITVSSESVPRVDINASVHADPVSLDTEDCVQPLGEILNKHNDVYQEPQSAKEAIQRYNKQN